MNSLFACVMMCTYICKCTFHMSFHIKIFKTSQFVVFIWENYYPPSKMLNHLMG